VNWDPKLLTAISDLEVQQVEVKGSSGICAIRWKARRSIPKDPASFIVVATRAPRPMLGDSAVAVQSGR